VSVSVGVSFVTVVPEISVTLFRSFAVAKAVHYFTCIDIRLSDRVRSFDCTIRNLLQGLQLGFQ
jgi:hypothetical protein